MDIKIPDNWLKDYLDTKANPEKIAQYLSLCGPSVERVHKLEKDSLYDIEITTNRIDMVSVYGIAREASAILPRFNVDAKLKRLKSDFKQHRFAKKVNYLSARVDTKLCQRFTAVLIRDVRIKDSPVKIRERLEASGVRPINNIVDISNYIMLALGQPVHTFDYDKIKEQKMILRQSVKGEKITTLDGKEFTLPGGDIVIEDGKGRLIDLAGIMGGALSAVDTNTKNVLLFVQTYDPVTIRKTSMSLAQRTLAATIFEKGTDPELITPAIVEAIKMFKNLTKGIPEKDILDIYPNPHKTKTISVSKDFIEKRMGVEIQKKDISKYLNSLEFSVMWTEDLLKVSVPSFRARDIRIEEDVIEEIARIHGYHNLPSQIMNGDLPGRPTARMFTFEKNIKNILSGWGGAEVYTLALVAKNMASEKALKLKNSLGPDTEYLRTSLLPSLVVAAESNLGNFDKFHLFEMANVYLPKKHNLPDEVMTLAGIFSGVDFKKAKGVVEALLQKLNVQYTWLQKESNGIAAGKSLALMANKVEIGRFGVVEGSKLTYYELNTELLFKLSSVTRKFAGIPKYPAQIEDITLVFPEKTFIGPVIDSALMIRFIEQFELKEVYKDSYTFRIKYQSSEKTLTDKEVEKIRSNFLSTIKSKFGATVKE